MDDGPSFSSDRLAKWPKEYFAVIFSSLRRHDDNQAYRETAAQMERLAAMIPGYLGVESVREEGALGITVSYWQDLKAIEAWRTQTRHLEAQEKGKSAWYKSYSVRICKVIRQYDFLADEFSASQI